MSLKNTKGVIASLERRLLGEAEIERLSAYIGANQDDAIASMEPCIIARDSQEAKFVNIVPRLPVEADFVDRLNIILVGRLDYHKLSEIDSLSGNLRIYSRSRNV